MDDLFSNEGFLTLLATIVGGLLTWFKASEYYERIQESKWQTAWTALESAVYDTYQVYVKDIKHAKADGKLTEQEKRAARERAKRRAIEFAASDGVDLTRTLGAHYLDTAIAEIVEEMKSRAGYVPKGAGNA